MRRASVKMSPQWPRSAATSPINTRLCLPPDASSRALDPTTIRRTHLPRHSNPHSRVRGTLRAPSPAGSFLGGFRTTAPGARRSHLDRPSSETLNTCVLMHRNISGGPSSARRWSASSVESQRIERSLRSLGQCQKYQIKFILGQTSPLPSLRSWDRGGAV
jgi:hypothetical protein